MKVYEVVDNDSCITRGIWSSKELAFMQVDRIKEKDEFLEFYIMESEVDQPALAVQVYRDDNE